MSNKYLTYPDSIADFQFVTLSGSFRICVTFEVILFRSGEGGGGAVGLAAGDAFSFPSLLKTSVCAYTSIGGV